MKLHLSLCLCLCMCVYVCVSQKILKHNSSKIHPTLYYMNFWQKPRCIQNGNFVRVQMTESSNVGGSLPIDHEAFTHAPSWHA